MRRLVTVAAVGAAAAAAQMPDMSATKAGFEALERGKYMQADDRLKSVSLRPDGSIQNEGAFQVWEQIHPMLVGELPIGGLHPPKARRPPPPRRTC